MTLSSTVSISASWSFSARLRRRAGRPGYDPRDLLKLYIYGYLNEVRSSRRLERECKRNVEVMWLVRRLAPITKPSLTSGATMAQPSSAPAEHLFCSAAARVFTRRTLSRSIGPNSARISKNRVLDRQRLAAEAEKIDKQIEQYLTGLDEADADEPLDAESATARALAALKARQDDLNRLSACLDQDDRSLIVAGEPDARPMGFGRGGKPPSYNVQIAVDADTGIVIHHDVTDEVNDIRMLHPMAKATKNLLGKETVTVVADTGYSNGTAAAACEADGIVPCVPVWRR